MSAQRSDSVLIHVRHAILNWRHAEDMNSVERWEELARHITDWVDSRRVLPDPFARKDPR